MHVQTHILSGWCFANCLPCTPRQRLFAMIAASAADIDGLSYLFGQQAYWNYHHTFGHNLFAAIIVSAILAALSNERKIASFFLYLPLFHLHLLMDYYGSGPDWHIHYLWPLKQPIFRNPNAWAFYSRPNLTVFLLFLFWTFGIAWRKRHTPLEALMPRLDHELVALLHREPASAKR